MKARECRNCGMQFYCPSGREQVWCADKCRQEARRRAKGVKPRQFAPEYSPVSFSQCGVCTKWFSSHGKRHGQRYCADCRDRLPYYLLTRTNKGKMETSCTACGISFSRLPGSGTMACSDKCSKASDRASKAKRRKAAKDGETFDPLRVFFRDGWRCRHCGRKTPESKRGSTASNAPELDHIVPLSAGGRHTKANTQLLCRRCNHTKGAGALFDQTLLFG